MKIKIFREYLDIDIDSNTKYRSLTTIKDPVLFIPGSWIFKKCGPLSILESLIFVMGSLSGLIIGVMTSDLIFIFIYFPITITISFFVSFFMAYIRNNKPRKYLIHKIWQTGMFNNLYGVKNIFYDKNKTTIYGP